MSRPLRDTNPKKVHIITCRTALAELLMVPSAQTNNIIGGVIARYAELYQVEIFALCILSNHYHIVVRAPEAQLPLFAENIDREISKRMNRRLRREGSFWGRRYDDQITVEEKDAVEALLYPVTNPVKHGLVVHPSLWPGVSTYRQTLGAKPEQYSFMHYKPQIQGSKF